MKSFLLGLLFCPLLLVGQTSHGFLIKSLVLQNAIHQNPNIIVEKLINKNYSVEMLLALRNGDYYVIGGEGPPIPEFATCTGFTIGLSARAYFWPEMKIPNAWFVSGMLRYNDTKIKKAKFQTGIHSEYRMVNLSRKGPELGFVFGRQLSFLRHFTTEFYIGGGAYLQFRKEDYISGPEMEVIPEQTKFTFRPYMGWTVGYLFNKK